jgi:hypothetical protein
MTQVAAILSLSLHASLQLYCMHSGVFEPIERPLADGPHLRFKFFIEHESSTKHWQAPVRFGLESGLCAGFFAAFSQCHICCDDGNQQWAMGDAHGAV